MKNRMKLEITDYETTVIKGIHTDIFFGTCEGIDFIAEHGSSEYCGAWSNGATKEKGFDTLFEKYGDDFTDAIWEWWNIYECLVESAVEGLQYRANERYKLKREVA